MNFWFPGNPEDRGAQWLSACLKNEGLWVRTSTEALHCVHEQDTSIPAWLLLVEPRKTRLDINEKLLTGT